jgi:hypothetical protein
VAALEDAFKQRGYSLQGMTVNPGEYPGFIISNLSLGYDTIRR